MTDLSGLPPLSSGALGSGAGLTPETSAAAPASANPPAGAGVASTGSSSSSPNFGQRFLHAAELGLVTVLGTFASSPILTGGTITWRNYAAAGAAAGFAGLWALARALGFNAGNNSTAS